MIKNYLISPNLRKPTPSSFVVFELIFFVAVFLASSSFSVANPPFSGTIFVESDILTAEDPSDYLGVSSSGRGNRTMYDRRVPGWVRLNAYLFEAHFEGMPDVEVQVNPEFDSEAAAEIEAIRYAEVVGRMPRCLRVDLKTMWIHKGNNPYGGGNNNILIHTGKTASYENQGILEETLIHEASHTSLDSYHANAPGWLAAQQADNEFISTYARDYPSREDVAESFLLYYAYRFRRERISNSLAETIVNTIPNRIAYFDKQDLGIPLPGGWSDATELQGSWWHLDWLGTYYTTSGKWFYHSGLGWLYRASGYSPSNWFYHTRFGWFWIEASLFPTTYLYNSDKWIHFDFQNSLYYDYEQGKWFGFND